MHSLGEHTPIFVIDLPNLFGRDPRAGEKIIFKLLFVNQRRVLRTNQGGLSNREKLRECLIFNYRCTG